MTSYSSSFDMAILEQGYIQKFQPNDSFSCTVMEDELTCPVCLELFADPLMLPCSHSICKKCLQDILHSNIKMGREGIQCPACRKSLVITKEKICKLPRNLALENIVIRFQEIQSNTLTKTKSLDLSSDVQFSLNQSDSDIPVFVEETDELCELCEGKFCARAEWFCEQCAVLYCNECLEKFHPRRGSLSQHRLRKPHKSESENKPAFCSDHNSEVASVFCDQCKLLVCHLCVCDGIGKHSGHKILSQDVASQQIKDSVGKTKEQLDGLMSKITEQTSKIEDTKEEIQTLHSEAMKKIENQYCRLLEDVASIIHQQKDLHLKNLNEKKEKSINALETYLNNNLTKAKSMENMTEMCKKLLDEDHVKGILEQASEVSPIVEKVEKFCDEIKQSESEYLELVADNSIQQSLRSSVAQFRNNITDNLQLLLDDDECKCQSIVPIMQTPASPGKGEGPRVQNKCLMTWGFTSTTFTAETLDSNAFWSVTIERNSAQIGDLKSGYVFGAGIASERLNYKDQVGIHKKSVGIICNNGSIQFCQNGVCEFLMMLEGLPLSVTLFVRLDCENSIILGYTLTNTSWGDTLTGKKIITDEAAIKNVYPVFTVSQKVKMQFPTYV